MAEENQVADYFVVAGLPDDPKPMDDYTDGTHLKQNQSLAPITDITVIFPSLGEKCPDNWQILDSTPTGLLANLNFGSLNCPEAFICYKRGRHKPPLVDIGVLYENKERILSDSEIVLRTPYNRIANVNNANSKTFLTYRRARKDMPANELVVTNICVIVTSKGEKAPHAFCIIKKNLNKGVFAQDVFLCYKKSMNRANLITYKPGILCRYPMWDRPDWKLHSNVPLFCLPMGATLEVWPPEASQPAPVFSTFVLTVSDASEKIYGSAITFYERYPLEKLTEEQLSVLEKSLENDGVFSETDMSSASSEKSLDSKENSLIENMPVENLSTSRQSIISGSHSFNVNKCICLLSHWPFFEAFESFLSFLYELSITGSLTIPIERYISHFFDNVAFPSPQRPRILLQLSIDKKVVLYQPEDIPLPKSGAGFRELLSNLSSEDYLLILLLVLTEHKILVHSLRSNVLTSVVEALSMIMFPFKWQCPYIPLCPLGLAEVLHAPVPFLIGVDSRFFDLYDPPSDVTCIDLDTNNITLSEEKKNLTYKLLPRRAAKNLRNTLEALCKKCSENESVKNTSNMHDEDYSDSALRFIMKDKEQKMELEIQEAFLRFMATILKGYRSYLLPIIRAPTVGTTDPKSLFDLQGFLKSRDRSDHKFFIMLMKTQMFIRFIEERSFVSDMDVGLAFFDECTEKVEDSGSRLLEFEDIEESHKSERTVFIPPPDPSGLPPGVTYSYQAFNLDNSLFKSKDIKSALKLAAQENAPGSPLARRTKHEVKSAQKLARQKHMQSAQSWAKYLLTTCYSLWFIHLPSFVLNDSSKSSVCLRIAYDLLVKIQKLKLHPTDEVCYRVMMQLFGIYSQPVLAVNLLSQMKSCGIQPNALTYGYYNRAVLEATWPSDQSHPSQLWSKLRNVIVGAALFRRGGQKGKQRLSEAESCLSIASLEKGDLVTELEKLMKKRHGSIMKPTQQNLQELISDQTLENSAGILMTGLKRSPPLTRRQKSCTEFNPRLKSTSGVSSDVGAASRLRRGSLSPTISENETLKLLIRCDSFANDTSIVEKHNRTNKTIESCQTYVASKTFTPPRESSESLDVTYEPSLDDSWDSQRGEEKHDNSLREESKMDTPSKTLLSKLNCLGSDLGEEGHTMSQYPNAPMAYYPSKDDKSDEEREPRKSLWKSSDNLMSCNEKLRKKIKEEKNQRSLSEMKKVTREKNNYDQNDVKVMCSNSILNSSEEFSEIEENLNHQSETSKSMEGDCPVVSDNGCGDGMFKESVPSTKTSPIRTPVTENDPLGALQSEIEVNKTSGELKKSTNSEKKRAHEQTMRMKYDLLVGGMFSLHPLSKSSEKKEAENSSGYHRSSRKKGSENTIGDDSTTPRVPKSATFYHAREKEAKAKTVPRGSMPPTEENEVDRKALQRSTTMPDTAVVGTFSSTSSVASSLSSFSSNFKFPFSRYSPSRFSLKKSDIRNAKTQILENAISGSKKSNELLLSGFHTVKSAATSVAKKIEEVISTNSTPVKSSNTSYDFEEDELDCTNEKNATLDFESWGSNLKEFFGDGSRKGSSANLQPPGDDQTIAEDLIAESLYGKATSGKITENSSALKAVMTTCCKCNNCCSILHDEEIISGWTPDDSNLNTKCHFCEKSTLPFLTVTLYDYRNGDKKRKCSFQKPHLSQGLINRNVGSGNSSVSSDLKNGSKDSKCDRPQSDEEENERGSQELDNVERKQLSEDPQKNKTENKGFCEKHAASDKLNLEINNVEPYVFEPIIVPYLNPLVLRKELENILHHEGDPSLTNPSFVDQHPIVFWNMVWVFERINFTSHLPDLIVRSSIVKKKNHYIHPSWSSEGETGNTSIKCLWDNPRIYEEVGQPMYVLWQMQNHQSPLISALVTERTVTPRSVMQIIINNLRRDKLYESMRLLVNERTKLRHCHSLYRDILFLAIAACDRANIILDFFDREYTNSYEKLRAEDVSLLDCDKPPVSASYRNFFRPLLLSHQIG